MVTAENRHSRFSHDASRIGAKRFVPTYRSHLDPGVSFERIHFAFAVAQAAQAAPHFAVGNFGRSSPGLLGIVMQARRETPKMAESIRENSMANRKP